MVSVYAIFGKLIQARKAIVRVHRSQARSDKGEGAGGGGGEGFDQEAASAPPPPASSNPDASLNIVIATKVSQQLPPSRGLLCSPPK